jgi:hypothetical protein
VCSRFRATCNANFGLGFCLADNTNWTSHQTKSKTNKTGGAYPPDTNPGVSNIPVVKHDKFPVVPPLPVSSKYAPDGSDEWDGELEPVDKDQDGYFTGRSLHAEKSPSPRERLTLAQLSDRSGVADLVGLSSVYKLFCVSASLPCCVAGIMQASMRLLNKLRKDDMFKGGIGNRAAFDSMERLRQRRRYVVFRQYANSCTVVNPQLSSRRGFYSWRAVAVTLSLNTVSFSQRCACPQTGTGKENRLGMGREART